MAETGTAAARAVEHPNCRSGTDDDAMTRELLDILHCTESIPIGEPYTLATVVRVEGSSYRLPGARMLVDAAGRRVGSVSGGCLESEVARRGRLLTADRPTVLVRFDSTDDDVAWGFGLGCNGAIDVLIERCVGPEAGGLGFIGDCVNRRSAGTMVTIFDVTSNVTGDADLVLQGVRILTSVAATPASPLNSLAKNGNAGVAATPYRQSPSLVPGSRCFITKSAMTDPEQILSRIPAILSDLDSVADTRPATFFYQTPGGRIGAFIESISPPLQIVIFGAGYDAVPLAAAAKNLGWHVTVWDRRADHARADRFPSADRVVASEPTNAIHAAAVTPDTITVVMNHHYPTDAELVGQLLDLPARYVGVLGPRARTDRIVNGRAGNDRQPLFAPVGLDIGADGPDQVAVAVVAEILSVLAGRDGGPLRFRDGPIHLSPHVLPDVSNAVTP